MSNHLTSLAYKVNVGSLLRKSVLVLLADKASDDGSGIWASKQTMADELCCSKRAVIATLQAFVAEGLLTESGQRKNRNGYTVTYTLNVPALTALPRVSKWASEKVDQVTGCTGEPDAPVNVVPLTGAPDSPEPFLNHPVGSEACASSPTPRAKRERWPAPDGVSDEVWADFLASPKRRKAGMSDTAYRGILNNLQILAEHGYPPGAMVALAVERGWATVKLDWVQGDGRSQTNQRSFGRMGGPGTDPVLAIVRAANEAQRQDGRDHGPARLALPSG